MRSVVVPSIAYVALAAAYLGVSGAPLRVHALSLVVFAGAFLVPGLWAARMPQWRGRLVVCSLWAMAAMLMWDATAHFVIVKAEPFSILLSAAWLYLLGGIVLVLLSFGIAWVASPPNRPIEADLRKRASPARSAAHGRRWASWNS